MIKKFVYLFLFLSLAVSGQQTINKLITKELTVQDKVEVTSTTKSSKPCPVMTETQRNAILSPATGSCVYNSNSLQLNVYDGTTWQEAGGGGISLWETGLTYDVNDVVIESDRIYRCLIAHTSGTFSTDLANGNWTEISEMQIVNLATGVTGILPTANGGTGSATQNFVDLTTNQTVAGEKTFSNTLKSDSIQTTGSSGVVIKNSSGTTVADFGSANTTNVSIVGSLNIGGNVTGANLSGTNTGDTEIGNDSGNIGLAKEFDFPNSQVVQTNSTNKKFRIESGNNNELYNGGFEAETLAVGWTVSNATPSSSTTGIEGSRSLSLELTGVLSLSQSSTINALQKSGVQMMAYIWVKSDDVSDLQLCSLKNDVENNCTAIGDYTQGTGWKQLVVPFLGDSTSNGLKLKSTDTTGTVLVDQAFVGFRNPTTESSSNITTYNATLSNGLLYPIWDFTSPLKLPDPATLPAGNGRGAAWSPDGQFLSVAHNITPFITIYQRSGTTFTKLSNPATLPADHGKGVSWSPDGQFLSVAHGITPFITIYQRSGTTFTKLANPATLPTGTANGAAWSPDGQFLSVAHDISPFITIYQRSGTTFTKLANPATLPTGAGYGTSWSPDGQFLSVAHDISPYITIYQRSGTTFTKLSNPATLPTATGRGTGWSPDGQFLSVAHGTTPYITIYQRSGTTFTKLSNPTTLPTGAGYGTSWSPDGQFLSVAHGITPFITIYQRSGTTFTKLSNPATLPTGDAFGAAWSPDGQFLSVGHNTTPFITIYRTGSNPPTGIGTPSVINVINKEIK